MSRKWVFPLGLIIVILIAFFFYNRYAVAPSIDFNRLSLVDLKGEPVKFSDLGGKKTIVCFSASWCPNCLTELRDINAVKASELSDVQVLVISDEPLEVINAFAERTAYPFTFLKLGQQFAQIGINAIPTSYLLNSSQHVKKETVGFIDWKDPSACEHMKTLMD